MTDVNDSCFATDEARWQAVSNRDSAADGHFVYGVVTTGIFCHPSCASRAARRENLRWFVDAAAAHAAGLRACLRCRSDQAPPAVRYTRLVEQACRLLDDDPAPSIAQVATTLGIGRVQLQRRFTALIGVGPKAWQLGARRARLVQTLSGSTRITDAAFEGGYGSASRLYGDVAERLGMTATALRAGAPNEHIRFVLADSALGRLIVGWTDRGLCLVAFGEDDATLRTLLCDRFPKARIDEDVAAGADLVKNLIVLIESPREATDLPLDIRGTAFQERVWQALLRIPVGETRSYKAIAEAIGEPAASRAVASACGANSLALVVPCHRVVRADGSLSGYRWGVERKRLILERERTTDIVSCSSTQARATQGDAQAK